VDEGHLQRAWRCPSCETIITEKELQEAVEWLSRADRTAALAAEAAGKATEFDQFGLPAETPRDISAEDRLLAEFISMEGLDRIAADQAEEPEDAEEVEEVEETTGEALIPAEAEVEITPRRNWPRSRV